MNRGRRISRRGFASFPKAEKKFSWNIFMRNLDFRASRIRIEDSNRTS